MQNPKSATPLGWARMPILVLALISMVSNLLMLTGPLFMLQVYDRVLTSGSIPTLLALTVLVCGIYTFYAFVEWMRSRMAVRFAGSVDEMISTRLFQASVRSRVKRHGPTEPDSVRDLDTLRQFLGGGGPLSLFDLPWIPVYLAIVFLFHPSLGWLATAGMAVLAVLLGLNEVFSHRPSRNLTAAAANRQGLLEGARANAESVLAMGMLEALSTRWRQASAKLSEAQHQSGDGTALYSSVTKAFRLLLQSAVLALGAYLVIGGELSAGLMIGASIVTSRALAPMEQVVAHWRGFVGARQAGRRIERTLQQSGTATRGTELPLPRKTLTVSRAVVGPAPEKRLVTGLDFSLLAGEGLGVIGPSGSGKTSLLRALTGVWPALAGEVRLDDSELQHYSPERLGTAVGYLPQVVELFDGTVAENIARFSPDAADTEVLAAAHAAGVHELIASLPDGYDTRIGDGGALLSAGQRQRIGLARALFGAPFLLLLDEPNANLDSEGDAALTEALVSAKARGAIVVVVAHRPSAIVAMDKLLLIQGGRQAAFGPKEEVLRRSTQPAPVVAPIFGGGTRSCIKMVPSKASIGTPGSGLARYCLQPVG